MYAGKLPLKSSIVLVLTAPFVVLYFEEIAQRL